VNIDSSDFYFKSSLQDDAHRGAHGKCSLHHFRLQARQGKFAMSYKTALVRQSVLLQRRNPGTACTMAECVAGAGLTILKGAC
jgi:hypothetical protein